MVAFLDGQSVDEWAARHGASADLPRLVRRLIWATAEHGDIVRITFPAGADVTLSGFDGELEMKKGYVWIPEGSSIWELSIQAAAAAKAKSPSEKF